MASNPFRQLGKELQQKLLAELMKLGQMTLITSQNAKTKKRKGGVHWTFNLTQ